MGKFSIRTGNDGHLHFFLKADNGQIILSSEPYTTMPDCTNGIESVRKNSPDSTNYERLTAANGKFYFNLKAANGQVIGKSQMYEGDDGCENGISSVIKNAPNADVEYPEGSIWKALMSTPKITKRNRPRYKTPPSLVPNDNFVNCIEEMNRLIEQQNECWERIKKYMWREDEGDKGEPVKQVQNY